ncbi:MAG: outer membrane lipid asymmetry maintenance protein MlaD [Pseudomonadota bacterium]
MKSSALETWVGALVLAAAVGFLTFAYSHAERGAGAGAYPVIAKFGRIDGIVVGSDVRLAGVKIGTVTGQKLNAETFLAEVEMTVSRDVEIPDDSVAKIAVDSLLGGAHIAIEPGGSEFALAAGDEFTYTQGSVDLLGLAFRALGGGLGASDSGGASDDGFGGDAPASGGGLDAPGLGGGLRLDPAGAE